MRTTQEILARIKAVEKEDWMGTQRGDLIYMLPWEHAKGYTRPEITEEQWAEAMVRNANPMDSLLDYLSFAWDKANNCRGLSAGRSLEHIQTWLWLAGYDLDAYFDTYDRYGKRQLVLASVLAGFDWQAHDDKQWVNGECEPPLDESDRQAAIDDATTTANKAKEHA